MPVWLFFVLLLSAGTNKMKTREAICRNGEYWPWVYAHKGLQKGCIYRAVSGIPPHKRRLAQTVKYR